VTDHDNPYSAGIYVSREARREASMERLKAALAAVEKYADCGDNSCLFKSGQRRGMGTNGGCTSAERIAERHGFDYNELTMFLGHEPQTWRPR